MLREDGPRFKLCRRKLGAHMVPATNLAPIISQHANNSDAVFNARTSFTQMHTASSWRMSTVKVATFLTMPLSKDKLSFSVQVQQHAPARDCPPLHRMSC